MWMSPWGTRFRQRRACMVGIRNLADKQPPIYYLNNVVNANTDVETYDTHRSAVVGRIHPEVLIGRDC